MTKTRTFILLILCTLLALIPTLHAESIISTNIKGQVELPLQPKRIVVLDYAVLDTIQKLGVDVEVALAKRTLPSYLAEYNSDKHTDIGSLKEFNLETISQFKPEAIFITTRQAAYYDELAKIAPVSITSPSTSQPLEEIKKNIKLIASLFAKQQEADKYIKQIDTLVSDIKAKASSNGKKTLFVLANDGKLSAYGEASRFGMIYSTLGFTLAGPAIEASSHGKRINYEYIALANPDIIYVIDRAAAIGRGAQLEGFAQNALVSRTKAAKQNGIVALDSQVWYLVGGGITATKTMLEDLAKAL